MNVLQEQYQVAEQLKEYIKCNGIKQGYVASECGTRQAEMSEFLNHRAVLSKVKFDRVVEYLARVDGGGQRDDT